jgi:26S proteasome regulatory subunit N6
MAVAATVLPVAKNDVAELTKYVQTSLLEATEDIKKREDSLLKLGKLLSEAKELEQLKILIHDSRPFFSLVGAARSTMIIRNLIELCLKITGGDGNIKIETCNIMIQWAKDQGRVYLRQALQARLVRLLNDLQCYTASTKLSNELITELKKVEDKDLIIQVHLENSKAYYALSSLGRAKTSLVAARTTANAIYVSSKMQAALDMHSGIIHASEEGDFKTAFSYFYEAFEGYDSVNEKEEALQSLKYMLLSQIMLGNYDEIKSVMMNKNALKYSNSPHLDAMIAIANALKHKSMNKFNAAVEKYGGMLKSDVVVQKHFAVLHSTMFEKDLFRLVKPYSRVDITHIAKTVGMTNEKVERKLSQMILDKKLYGCLHQGDGVLIVYDTPKQDRAAELDVEVVHALNDVLNALHARARLLR